MGKQVNCPSAIAFIIVFAVVFDITRRIIRRKNKLRYGAKAVRIGQIWLILSAPFATNKTLYPDGMAVFGAVIGYLF